MLAEGVYSEEQAFAGLNPLKDRLATIVRVQDLAKMRIPHNRATLRSWDRKPWHKLFEKLEQNEFFFVGPDAVGVMAVSPQRYERIPKIFHRIPGEPGTGTAYRVVTCSLYGSDTVARPPLDRVLSAYNALVSEATAKLKERIISNPELLEEAKTLYSIEQTQATLAVVKELGKLKGCVDTILSGITKGTVSEATISQYSALLSDMGRDKRPVVGVLRKYYQEKKEKKR